MEKEVNKEKPREPSFAPTSAEASAGKKATAVPSEVPKERRTEGEEELKKKFEECQKLKDEYLTGWQRERADFLNYKREELERVEEILKYADEGLILKILPILDNFEIAARQNFPSENLSGQEKERINQVIQGFLQIKNQILDFLKNQGVEEIKSVGEKFDPQLHEVVGEVAPSEALAKGGKSVESGIVIEEIQKGYKINGRLLRPAKVRVTK
ncbi:MAG: nucleotide exchange factor GrpE [Candidatus Nealsonbacteria bacterium CG_4_10_14_0_8_um_filter_35_10]|uniref:Protein GrpE n=1 Tax=Candidatus Nealsonbacteria bacterium CG_4_10_14_0_8_um_filter_35_10 TaxID=1974683 RepID=A0A2M7R806_9BACT|nr:MAG: nucleotide exchange factor GrpE [Candidatus Nealsonbacteria bacterium CG_4_10_14_0_8_um_filter_35_10]